MDVKKIVEWATIMRELDILRIKTPEMEIELHYTWGQDIPAEDMEVPEEPTPEVMHPDLYAEAFGGKLPSFK